MIAQLLVAWLTLLPMSPNVGKPRIVVLSTSSAPDQAGFVDILRIQLIGSGSVEVGPAMIEGSLAERVAHAGEIVDRDHATLAVWIERGPAIAGSGTDFILYLVGPRDGRALVEVFRLPVATGPAIDRALALKVRDALDRVLATRNDGRTTTAWVGATVAEPPPRRLWFLAELGAGFAAGLGSPANQGGPRLAAGLRARRGGLTLDAFAAMQFVEGFATSSRVGDVITSDLPLALGLRLSAAPGRLSWGGQLELGVRIVDADGVTPFGARGSVRNLVPTTLLGATVALPLRSGVELRALAGVEIALLHLHLAVNEVAVLDLGRIRPVGQLAVVIAIP